MTNNLKLKLLSLEHYSQANRLSWNLMDQGKIKNKMKKNARSYFDLILYEASRKGFLKADRNKTEAS